MTIAPRSTPLPSNLYPRIPFYFSFDFFPYKQFFYFHGNVRGDLIWKKPRLPSRQHTRWVDPRADIPTRSWYSSEPFGYFRENVYVSFGTVRLFPGNVYFSLVHIGHWHVTIAVSSARLQAWIAMAVNGTMQPKLGLLNLHFFNICRHHPTLKFKPYATDDER